MGDFAAGITFLSKCKSHGVNWLLNNYSEQRVYLVSQTESYYVILAFNEKSIMHLRYDFYSLPYKWKQRSHWRDKVKTVFIGRKSF